MGEDDNQELQNRQDGKNKIFEKKCCKAYWIVKMFLHLWPHVSWRGGHG
jgi:hypothetical protein